MNLAGTSLVAAIPAGFLGYLMLMAMINNMDTMPTILKVAAVVLFLIALMMTLFPGFVLIYHGGSKSKAEKSEGNDSETSAASTETDENGLGDGFEEGEDAFGEVETEGFDEAGDDVGFEIDDEVGDGVGFDFDDDDDDDDFGNADEFEFDEEDDEF